MAFISVCGRFEFDFSNEECVLKERDIRRDRNCFQSQGCILNNWSVTKKTGHVFQATVQTKVWNREIWLANYDVDDSSLYNTHSKHEHASFHRSRRIMMVLCIDAQNNSALFTSFYSFWKLCIVLLSVLVRFFCQQVKSKGCCGWKKQRSVLRTKLCKLFIQIVIVGACRPKKVVEVIGIMLVRCIQSHDSESMITIYW